MDSLFSRYRILPPLSGLIIGILLAEWMGNEWALISILSPVFGAISLFRPRLVFLIFVPIGILLSARTPLPENHILSLTGKKLDLEGVLFRSPESREKGSRLLIDTRRVFIGGKESRVSGRVIITTKERILGLAYGDRIRVLETELRVPRVFKNPGGFDIKRYYERQGIYAIGFVPGAESIISFGKDGSSCFLIHSLDRLRGNFGNFVRSEIGFPKSEIINAITIGDQGGIPTDLRNRFSEAGISHILSISGLHVGAIAIVFYVLIKWVLKRSEFLLLRSKVPRLAAALTILPISLYTVVAGFATPVMRASIMATLYLISIVIGREENRLNTLAASALIILLWHPWALFELSFQLSFASVLGILLMHRFYPFKLGTFKEKLLSSVKTTLAASFATLPFIIKSFGVLSTASVPANLLFVPLVEFLMVPLGLFSFLTFLISKAITAPFLYLDAFISGSLLLGVEGLLKIPFSHLTVPNIGTISWILYWLASVPILLWRTHPKLRIILPVLMIGFFIASAYSTLSKPNKGLLEVSFLDAGIRNIVFVQFPKGKRLLFDGGFSYYDQGGFIERAVATPFLLESGAAGIDYLVLTSLDRDHLEGIKNLLQRFRVERLWTNGSRLDGELWEEIKDKNILWKDILDDVEGFEIDGVRIGFLQPRGGFRVKDSSRPYPLIVKLTLGKISFIFGEGMMEKEVQRELVDVFRDRIKEGVLYIPRISEVGIVSFIHTVSPKSVVTNFASQAIMSAYEYKSLGVFQTDTQGTVTFLTDGNQVRVKTFVGEKYGFLQ